MKKHLLLFSVIGMIGTAHAQSSVAMFGTVDMSMARGTGSIADKTQMSRSGLSPSRIGFRAAEDLGGGTSAQFWLEAGFSGDDGSGSPTNTNNQASGATTGQGLTFGRRATIGLAAPWGEVRLGRDMPPQYLNIVYGDPFGLCGVGAPVNFTAIITGVTASRASNMVQYFTPNKFGGFAAQVAHYRGENASNTTNSKDGTGSGILLSYRNGPFASGIAWSRTNYASGDVQQRNANASWSFDYAKLTATYSSDRAGTLAARGGSIGVTIPVGASELRAAYSTYRRDSINNPEVSKLALGYVYYLSKRTALYSTLARVQNKGGSSVALSGAITAPDASSTGVELGINHKF